MRARVRKAFTLVEILIVVVILGILAAIVVPQFTSATQDAQGGNLQTQLSTLQQAQELFKAKNNAYHDLVTDGWQQLIDDGYIKAAPKNPVNGSTTVAAAAGAAVGWTWDGTELGASYFDEATGKITETP